MENILKDKTKFEKVDIKTSTLNFQVNHEKCINEILKRLKSSGNLTDKQLKTKNKKKTLKILDLDLVFSMAFVKFAKQLLMLVHLLDLYCLQLGHPLIKLLSFL